MQITGLLRSFRRNNVPGLLVLTCFFTVSGCSMDGGASNTPVHSFASEQREGTLRFGLPSVSPFINEWHENDFGGGKKGNYLFPGAQVQLVGIRVQPDGALSIIRDWTIVHNTFKDEYQLRSEQSILAFLPPLDKIRPTSEMLRRALGRWIIFPGDDMRRVREVRGDFFARELIFNDGRAPASTYEPDVKQKTQ